MPHTVDERIWSEWLALYVERWRRDLSGLELAELAQALEQGVETELPLRVTERVATVSRPLVEFILTAPNSELGAALLRESVLRLRATAASS
jgi:hypothetical protein